MLRGSTALDRSIELYGDVVRVAPDDAHSADSAFDITPDGYITAIATKQGGASAFRERLGARFFSN